MERLPILACSYFSTDSLPCYPQVLWVFYIAIVQAVSGLPHRMCALWWRKSGGAIQLHAPSGRVGPRQVGQNGKAKQDGLALCHAICTTG